MWWRTSLSKPGRNSSFEHDGKTVSLAKLFCSCHNSLLKFSSAKLKPTFYLWSGSVLVHSVQEFTLFSEEQENLCQPLETVKNVCVEIHIQVSTFQHIKLFLNISMYIRMVLKTVKKPMTITVWPNRLFGLCILGLLDVIYLYCSSFHIHFLFVIQPQETSGCFLFHLHHHVVGSYSCRRPCTQMRWHR